MSLNIPNSGSHLSRCLFLKGIFEFNVSYRCNYSWYTATTPGTEYVSRAFDSRRLLLARDYSWPVTPACLYGTETLALTELQQQRLHVCENNWVRKIARVTRADRRRIVVLREETGGQRSLTERLMRRRFQWAGHVERMADERLPKRAAELRKPGRRRRGRPRLRWEDCVKRDVRKA